MDVYGALQGCVGRLGIHDVENPVDRLIAARSQDRGTEDQLAVSVDEDPDSYSNFIRRRHVDLITVRDPGETAARLFNTDMWPETYLIDRNGVIRRKFVGATDWSDPEIRQYLKSL